MLPARPLALCATEGAAPEPRPHMCASILPLFDRTLSSLSVSLLEPETEIRTWHATCVACCTQQNRNQRPPKGDVNGAWKHDLYDGDKPLSARLGNTQTAPKINLNPAQKALAEAQGEGLSIKGASSRGNVVEVGGLAEGTTAADVEV